MPFVSQVALQSARSYVGQNLKKPDAFSGLVCLFLSAVEFKKNRLYLKSDMRVFSSLVDDAFYFSNLSHSYPEKYWYSLMPQDWMLQARDYFLVEGKKLSAINFLASLFWYRNYPSEKDAVQWFINSVGQDFFDNFFVNDASNNIFTESVPCTKDSLLRFLNGSEEKPTVKFDGSFIVKRASDLSGAPFSQTLYAGLEIKKIISIYDYDFMEKFDNNISFSVRTIKTDQLSVSKPFLLLAGISGTGKSRFVREQAKRSSGEDAPSNYELISVRPDWHEPSDLLGYVSRLGDSAPHFISTPTLKFMVSAWKNINPTEEELSINRFEDKNVLPYWLCLDEMNLAPVEQYFADYLSVIETREWTDDGYRCDPILKADGIKGLSDKGRYALKKDLGLEVGFDALWDYFCAQGVPIPYNLIVAGTVNMDETTHGFSRKVIDRALTVDFGEFFPNDFDAFFDGSQKKPIVLSYPTGSEAREETDGAVKSRQFLKVLNEDSLKETAFEVAFRALNELLLSGQSFAPYSDDDSAKLQAVWDDFLMMKVLPRIEGDRDKVEQVLEKLNETLTKQLNDIWSDEPKRPDLWRATQDLIPCRSKVKIKWMQGRLDKSGFTSFWP